jgi:hypothetical protein
MRISKGASLVFTLVVLAGATYAVASRADERVAAELNAAGADVAQAVAQIVALDECDPTSFNAVLGEGGGGFCHNVALAALGFATKLEDLFAKAAAGSPDPGWDFEPDRSTIRKGTLLSVVNQGGEPHTFTEVKHFGGGFVAGLNHGEAVVPECDGGFANVAVARTRIIQGSRLDVPNLPKGKHMFQCCIHPWMRTEVEVK